MESGKESIPWFWWRIHQDFDLTRDKGLCLHSAGRHVGRIYKAEDWHMALGDEELNGWRGKERKGIEIEWHMYVEHWNQRGGGKRSAWTWHQGVRENSDWDVKVKLWIIWRCVRRLCILERDLFEGKDSTMGDPMGGTEGCCGEDLP